MKAEKARHPEALLERGPGGDMPNGHSGLTGDKKLLISLKGGGQLVGLVFSRPFQPTDLAHHVRALPAHSGRASATIPDQSKSHGQARSSQSHTRRVLRSDMA